MAMWIHHKPKPAAVLYCQLAAPLACLLRWFVAELAMPCLPLPYCNCPLPSPITASGAALVAPPGRGTKDKEEKKPSQSPPHPPTHTLQLLPHCTISMLRLRQGACCAFWPSHSSCSCCV